MRQTNSKAVNHDWNYADGFLKHAMSVCGQQLMTASPMEIDCEEASDIIFIRSGRGDIAFRVRRPGYFSQYPYDITFRSARERGVLTELDKILDGKGEWFLYGFASADGCTMDQWVFLDLSTFRSMILRGVVKRSKLVPNGDGTWFEPYDVRILKGKDPKVIRASTFEIPEIILPAAPRETKQQFWQRMRDGK